MTAPTNYFVHGPSVLVLREKHGNRYFDAGSDSELNRAALAILRERDTDGYWYLEPKRDEYVREDDDKTVTEFEAIAADVLAQLPESTRAQMQTAYDKAVQHRTRGERAYKQERDWWELMKSLLAQSPEEALVRTNRAGRPLCFLALQYRGNGEYEGYEIEPLEVA